MATDWRRLIARDGNDVTLTILASVGLWLEERGETSAAGALAEAIDRQFEIDVREAADGDAMTRRRQVTDWDRLATPVARVVEHADLGPGVVTSVASEGWLFVKFPARCASRMCRKEGLHVHEPLNDDGVTYCGWTTEAGTSNGCGHVWPCPTALAAKAVA